MTKLDGSVAVVTGGASGIGERTVRLFVAEGASVVIADIQDERGQAITEQLGSSASFIHTDVTREPDIEGAVAEATSRFGRLDCMFNNAGLTSGTNRISETPMEEYDAMMAVLLRGVFMGIKHAAAVMRVQKPGTIISTSSVAGLQGGLGGHVCSAAKAAIISLTRTAAGELGAHGIRVNCICPGFVATPLVGRAVGLSTDEAASTFDGLRESLSDMQPTHRIAEPLDIALAALWLASEDSGFVNGHALAVDGGLMAARPHAELGRRMAKALEPQAD